MLTLFRFSPRHAAALAIALLLVACATAYGPSGLVPGRTTADEAAAAMGPPTGRYALPGGGQRLEFARGPLGRHTYMVDFDAQGRMTGWNQVLSEARFHELRPGMSKDEVLLRIGHPSNVSSIPRQQQTVWSYRYETYVPCQWFQIGLDPQGRIVDFAYSPDPLCSRDDVFTMRMSGPR